MSFYSSSSLEVVTQRTVHMLKKHFQYIYNKSDCVLRRHFSLHLKVKP
jgi:hypothetical protein